MKNILLLVVFAFTFSGLQAQNSDWIYATIDNQNSQTLKQNLPADIEILESSENISAVYMSPLAAMELKEYGNLHGPGYIFRKSESAALQALHLIPQGLNHVLDFTITEDAFISGCLDLVNHENIGNTILDLEGYGTRFHTKPSGVQASIDIKNNWEAMVNAADRNDISVDFFNHSFTNQKSVIVTIQGTQFPDEIVVVGGHLDSGDYSIQNFAPGADDNASGIGVLTETLRILLESGFHPTRTVQIMGYAAEEVGLYGSADIAQSYANSAKNVLAALQLDMTNYKGSDFDIAIISDSNYTSNELNLFLIELLEHYHSNEDDPISYGISYCGYACSDHVSWTENGYPASFPFEAAMNDTNPFIHTTNDTYANMGSTAVHSAKFVKLALEFIIEIAKTQTMSNNEVIENDFSIVVNNKNLMFDFKSTQIQSVQIFDSSARLLIQQKSLKQQGNISLHGISPGYYIAVFKDAKGKSYSKKFLLK